VHARRPPHTGCAPRGLHRGLRCGAGVTVLRRRPSLPARQRQHGRPARPLIPLLVHHTPDRRQRRQCRARQLSLLTPFAFTPRSRSRLLKSVTPVICTNFLHRFGSALNARFNFHVVVLDGVFSQGDNGGVTFHEATHLAANDRHRPERTLQRRVLRLFRAAVSPASAPSPRCSPGRPAAASTWTPPAGSGCSDTAPSRPSLSSAMRLSTWMICSDDRRASG
jgi:hypothetical protein